MVNMDIERTITWMLTIGGFGMTIFLMRRWLARIEHKQDQQEKQYHACREELPKRFSSREKTECEFARLWERSDRLADDVAYAKGLRNGSRV